ncbi:TLD-domain-containing protein [Melampsora americana]|nr:TLD-domain-containing protein [Melampsora americana]
MQDLLDEFDPLSLNQTNPSNKLNTIQIKPIHQSSSSSQQTSSSKPLFDFNPTRPPVSNTSSTTSILTTNKTIQSTKISSSDPLDAFSLLPTIDQSFENETILNKSDQLLIEAKQRDKLRKDALEKHLTHIPFEEISRPSSPLITLQDLGIHHHEIKSPKSNSKLMNESSIKIPTEYFHSQSKFKSNPNSPQNQIRKPISSIPTSPKTSSNQTLETNVTKIDQEKLAAALEEDFDEFVSSSHLKTHQDTKSSVLKPMKEIEMMKSERTSPISFDGPEGRPIPIKLIGINPTARSIMDEELAEGIRLHLPTRLKISSKWELIYSIDQHGTSLSTLYTQSNLKKGSLILILKDHTDHRFGAFLNESLRPSKEYYGTGECFLWKSIEFDPSDFRIGFCVKKYEWTGINDYMILSDHEMLSVGGGDGKFGLWIDSNLEKGISTDCSTFNNEILSNFQSESNLIGREIGSFDILGLECWRILV